MASKFMYLRRQIMAPVKLILKLIFVYCRR